MTVHVASDVNNGAKARATKTGTAASLADFNVFLNQRSPLPTNHPAYTTLKPLRETATLALQDVSFPTNRDEEWRFTNVSPLLALNWNSTLGNTPNLTLSDIDPYILPEASTRLVFVNGIYNADLSTLDPTVQSMAGLTVGAMSRMPADLVSHVNAYLGQQQGLEQAFTTLNTASFQDAAVIRLARNAIAPTPIHILSISTAAPQTPILSHPRCLVIADAHSEVTVIEEFATIGQSTSFTNPVTEIYVEENAAVQHVRIQRDALDAFHIGKTAVSQAQTSRYACYAVNIGSQLCRHNLEVFQTGAQTETILNGLSMIAGQQVSDTHSLIAYEHPHSSSRQLHKTIVDGSAHAVFNGKVNVPQAAQLTDAGQLNRNLLLSPKGKVDTKPQLEIVADNVKCTHGATVSQLKADEVFYLQSRGIDATRAQSLLIYAFAAEILEALPIESLNTVLSQWVEGFIQAS